MGKDVIFEKLGLFLNFGYFRENGILFIVIGIVNKILRRRVRVGFF